MERDRSVEISLLELGLHCDCGRLEDFRSIRADHVDADDLVGRDIEHHFIERALVTDGEHVLHWPEVRSEGPDAAELVARLPFGHSDAGKRRMAEYRARDAAIIHSARLVAEEGVGKGLALPDR